MIVRMSKIEIAGPKELLLDVLTVIRELGMFQLEAETRGPGNGERRRWFTPKTIDERSAAERGYLEELRGRIVQLCELLPPVPIRELWLDPLAVLDTIAATLERHLEECRSRWEQREALRREQEELGRYAALLGTIETLIGDADAHDGVELIGVTLRDRTLIERLRLLLTRLTDGEFTLTTGTAGDGTLIGLIVTPVPRGERVKQVLSDEQLPELPFPASLRELSFPERIRRVRERIDAAARDMAVINAELERFARSWLAIYRRAEERIADRLALLRATAAVRETGMCFLISGWARADEATLLKERLFAGFGDMVVQEERQIREQDLSQVPVTLTNPPLLRPFERFTRLLPLPTYSSWDPTPFIGVFFPLFFGMMLGDAGHGMVLVIVALLVLRRHRTGLAGDAARILLMSAGYAVLFGLLFGECFGEAGARLLGLKAILTERSRAIMPMLAFSLALGVSHVLLGLVLGLIPALRKRETGESVGRLAAIGMILCLAALAPSLLYPSPPPYTRVLLVVMGLLVPFLFLSGGFLAPLELLRYIGNIISYVRIMAIGLGSVFLANAANHLAGLTGDLVLGTITAVILHAVAIVLGVFAPTIHGLRLHFVEFFSKFVEHGGRRFEPFGKKG